jgi:predicted phosphodiesterase
MRFLRTRRVIAVALVCAAGLTGAFIALVTVRDDRELEVATIRLSISPAHHGALDLYVPVVDWGARFGAVRMPVRLRVDVRSVDRQLVARVAGGSKVDVDDVRDEAKDAVAAFIRILIASALAASLVTGLLMAFALRSRTGPRLRWLVSAAIVTSAAVAVALTVLLPPRGTLSTPEYYAHGSDIPRALQALETVQASAGTLDEELDAQLVGLARLLAAPAQRPSLGNLPRVTIASDLHNNVLALGPLERAVADGPLLFAGDLTDRGSPLEVSVVQRVAHGAHPLVFVSGNHDSDTLSRALARSGAIVLGRRGQLLANGKRGAVVVKVAGLRIAGYEDPFERRSGHRYRAETPDITPAQGRAFADWVHGLEGRVDVIMVHEPGLAELALEELHTDPPAHPLVFILGHTHVQLLTTGPDLAVLNPGTVGAGGTGNLDESKPIGLAVLTYRVRPRFDPLAVDLVEIDPGDGSATARRSRLDLAG